jgi:hypothetical protein
VRIVTSTLAQRTGFVVARRAFGAYHGLMLPEQSATSYSNDPATSTVIIVSESTRPKLHGEVPARLLLDARSHVVGVDVAPDTPERVVVMLGPHEQVARAEDIRVLVENGGGRVRIQGHAAKLVAPGANPYVF